MRILYASCRYDPLDRDAGSGVDFNLYESFQELGHELRIVGPFKDHLPISERVYRKVHRLFSRKLTAKFSERYLHYCAKVVDAAAEEYQPDFIFSHNLIPLVYSRSRIPVVHKTDAILYNMHEQWPTYSRFEYQRMLRWEERALKRATLVVTASSWAEDALVEHYHIPKSRILVLPIPSSLPEETIPEKISEKLFSKDDVRLLSVGRDFNRKGIDISIQITQQLRSKGINANLRIVGLEGNDMDGVQFMGLYKKTDPAQLKEYVSQYQWAHLLIHPARHEAAGIVCGEAAAFGVPTITNASGGLATTVAHGDSGIVLPMGSPAEDYVEVIEQMLESPENYRKMQITSRKRYEQELNWNSAAKKILLAYDELQKC